METPPTLALAHMGGTGSLIEKKPRRHRRDTQEVLMKLGHLSTHDLELQAEHVERQIKKLAHRPRPTPSERKLSAELKRMRLTLKDRLDQVS